MSTGFDVLICYAPPDVEAARSLAETLRGFGLAVFFDKWELLPGDVVVIRMEEAIKESRAGVVLLSQAATESGWVAEQYAVFLGRAASGGQRLIPVRLDDTTVPEFLHSRAAVDLRGLSRSGYKTKVRELAEAILKHGDRVLPSGPLVVSGRSDMRDFGDLRDRAVLLTADLRQLLTTEVWRHLGHPNVVSRTAPSSHYRTLSGDPYISRLVPNFEWLDGLLSRDQDCNTRLGLINDIDVLRAFLAEHPLTVAITPSLVGAVAIFSFLNGCRRYKLNIKMNFAYSHAAQLVTLAMAATNDKPDAIGVLLAPAHKLLCDKSLEYQAFAVLPAQGYRVLSPRSDDRLGVGQGKYFTPLAENTGASIQIQRLAAATRGQSVLNSLSDIHPSEALSLLSAAESGQKFLLWSPYWHIADLLGLGSPILEVPRCIAWEDSMLFICSRKTEQFPVEFSLLRQAIRSAWLDILENPSDLQHAVKYMLQNRHYVTCFKRMLGVSSLLFDSDGQQ